MFSDISVILPVFQKAETSQGNNYLDRAIQSVLKQDYPGRYEIIIIDDGSPAPVANSMRRFGYDRHAHINCHRLSLNSGLINALNTGISLARYNLIGRIDADDSWLPGKIESQMKAFRADPELTIVGTGMRLIYEDGRPPVDMVRPGDWEGILKFFVEVGCPFPHGSILARKDVFKIIGGYTHDPRFFHCEDFATWGTWLRFFKPAMIEKVLYEYTVSGSSISAVHEQQQRTASHIVHRTFIENSSTDSIPSCLASLAKYFGLSLYDAGRLAFLCWKYRSLIEIAQPLEKFFNPLMRDRAFCAGKSKAQSRFFISSADDAQKVLAAV